MELYTFKLIDSLRIIDAQHGLVDGLAISLSHSAYDVLERALILLEHHVDLFLVLKVVSIGRLPLFKFIIIN